ncbi:MAG: CRISPR-associated endonuclease Cas1 [Candidatus Dadabacteria bacterium]|nr:MAG: CRISPR-associated endonuclease Cas1 [Candidatus Dadabacteria bacterium]
MNAYVTTQGAKIVKEGRHLVVKKDEGFKQTLFMHRLDQLVIFGSIEISSRALGQLFKESVDTVFLTRNGRYLGRLALQEPKNVFLRRKQHRLQEDKSFGTKMARVITRGKLLNMATLLMRIHRTREARDVRQKAQEIRNLLPLLDKAEDTDSIRGYEGRGSAVYFSAFGRGFIKNPGFARRVRRPPTDPVNSVLSLLYTFLMNRVYAGVRLANLDPYLGHLHSLEYGRYSLVLDLMEEFRTIIADTLTLSLFNMNILDSEKHFEIQKPDELEDQENDGDSAGHDPVPDVTLDPVGQISPLELSAPLFDLPEQRVESDTVAVTVPTGRYPVMVTPEGMTKIIHAFEKKLTTKFFHPPADRELTYSEAINFQAQQYRKLVEGEADSYQPLLLK